MNYLMQHPTQAMVAAVGVYFVFSNLVGALPAPDATTGKGYQFFYSFMHGLAGNIRYALQSASATQKFIQPGQ